MSIKDVALAVAEAMDFKGNVVFDTSKAVRACCRWLFNTYYSHGLPPMRSDLFTLPGRV